MKHLCPILFLIFSSGCATFSDRPTPEIGKVYAVTYYPVPDYPEAGTIDGKSRVVSPMQTVEEGVYYFDAGYSKLVLELSKGRYRFWLSSDGLDTDPPKYPLTGKFRAKGPTIRLRHKEEPWQFIWTFRKIDGATTVWRPNAVKAWHEGRRFDSHGVLYFSDRPAEEIWAKSDLKVAP